MADIRQMGTPKTEQGRAGLERVPAGGPSERAVPQAAPVAVETNGEAVVLPLEIESNHAEKLVALGVFLALCYFGKVVLATIMFSLLLAFSLEPIVEMLQKIRVPRSIAALIALGLLGAAIYGVSYFSYVRASDFIHELPKYTEKIKDTVVKYRNKAQQLQKTGQAMAPTETKSAIPVKEVGTGFAGLSSTAGSISETLLALSFIPVLAYFMITWRDHMRASAVKLFNNEARTTAYVAMGRIAQMLRAFIVGNVVIGVIMGAMSVGAFWWAGVPYFYFVGFISGLVSLVPYLGVLLALIPPLAAGIGSLSVSGILGVVVAVFVIHVFSFNVLYPKLLGPRVQLNPLVVTVSLLVWGFLWGAIGLVLAVPITAAIKIICDHVDSLRALGELMGEGRQSSG
jgi:predicted PurR-regulated permease PerM